MKSLKCISIYLLLSASYPFDGGLSAREGEVDLEWGGVAADPDGNVDIDDWIGWLNIKYEPWVWSYGLTRWMFAPDPGPGTSGAWAFLTMPDEGGSTGDSELVPSQSIIDAAADAPLIRYNRYLSGGAHTWGAFNGGWQIAYALAVAAGNTSAEAKMLQQIQYSLNGGNCISANGGYPSQHERHITGAYTILKDSDFWNSRLTAGERDKITLLMKATLVACAYTTADRTYEGTITTLDGDSISRGFNPNFREGMFGGLIHATVFFGGVSAVENILNFYDHDAFVTELQAAGLTNTAETFNWAVDHPDDGAPGGALIEANIRNYRLYNEPLKDPMGQLYDQTMNTYSKNVICGLNNGAGILWQGVPTGVIVSGCEDLPNLGAKGMLAEFDSVDGNGARSAIYYAYDGFRPNLTNHVVVVNGGYWRSGAQADEILSRMEIGITDLYYKLEHGYRSYDKGRGRTDIFDINTPDWKWSFITTLPLWFDVVSTYHGLGTAGS